MKNQKIFISLMLLLFSSQLQLFSQDTSKEKFDRMLNAYVLGMEDEMLSNCLDLISLDEYIDAREEALWFIAEYFMSKGISIDSTEADFKSLSKALTFYNRYMNEYASGKYIHTVKKRVDLLISKYAMSLQFSDYLNTMYAENKIVGSLLFGTTFIVYIRLINPFAYFIDSEFNQSPQYIANKYFDEIVINFPDYKVFAYQRKILMNLDSLSEDQLVYPGWIYLNDISRDLRKAFGAPA